MDAYCKEHVSTKRAHSCMEDAASHWDNFYDTHGDKFFKDRHWITKEFASFDPSRIQSLLEIGCGSGSTAIPISQILGKNAHVYACDFAPKAIEALQKRKDYDACRVTVFVTNIARDDLLQVIPRESIDAVTMIFVLSAIPPSYLQATISNISRTLRAGGKIFFRDYSYGDLSQYKFSMKNQSLASDGLFVRTDNTLVSYFKAEELKNLFTACGFKIEELNVVEKISENRKSGEKMSRFYLQGVFRKAISKGAFKVDQPGTINLIDASTMCDNTLQAYYYSNVLKNCRDKLKYFCYTLSRKTGESGSLTLHLKMPAQIEDHKTACSYRTSQHILAQAVFSLRHLLHHFKVIEIASGPAALPMFEAVRWCRMAVATDISLLNIQVLRNNILANGSCIIYERLRLSLLNQFDEIRIPRKIVENSLIGRNTCVLLALDEDDIRARCSRGEVEDASAAISIFIREVATFLNLACHRNSNEFHSLKDESFAIVCFPNKFMENVLQESEKHHLSQEDTDDGDITQAVVQSMATPHQHRIFYFSTRKCFPH